MESPSALNQKRILFSACDAGSANYFVSVLRALIDGGVCENQWQMWAHGPAAEIFKKNDLPFFEVKDVSLNSLTQQAAQILNEWKPRFVLTGTSWGMTIDKALARASSELGITSAAIVEHWNLYQERFSTVEKGSITNRLVYLPDEVWVNDRYAWEGAVSAGLPQNCLRIMGQPFLEKRMLDLKKLCEMSKKSGMTNRIVFISERLREDFVAGSALDLGTDEFQALELLVKSVNFERTELIVKLHPQESATKYDGVFPKGLPISITKDAALPELICSAKKVVGVNSMVLLEASLIRDDVISLMPDSTRQKFIGNETGATVPCYEISQLTRLLEDDASLVASKFGVKFQGSIARVTNRIQELLT